MNIENIPCPGCGHHMHEGDDIVVCPECATPQHRECWLENSCCVNQQRHSEGFVWSDGGIPEIENEPKRENNDVIKCHICGAENLPSDENCISCGALLQKNFFVDNGYFKDNAKNGEKICPLCAEKNDDDAKHCKRCGAMLINDFENAPISNPYVVSTGVPADEPIGDYTAEEYSIFTRNASKKYVPKFKKISDGKKIQFNFFAFLLSPYWFFYKKIYKGGVAAIIIFSVLSLAMGSTLVPLYELFSKYEDAIANQVLTQAQAEELFSQIPSTLTTSFYVVLALIIVFKLICGFIGNYLYYKNVSGYLKMFNEGVPDINTRKLVTLKAGGNSIISFICSFFLVDCIVSILTYLANLIST